MKRTLHFGALKSLNPGFKGQLDYELAASINLDRPHDIVFFSHDQPDRQYMKQPSERVGNYKNTFSTVVIKYFVLRIRAYKWLLTHQKDYDVIFIRYPLGDLIFPIFSLFLKPFYTIHHTKEIEEIQSKTRIISQFQLFLEKIQFRILNRKILGFIGVTNEISIYEASRAGRSAATMTYPNGVLGETGAIIDQRSGTVKLCCICKDELPWNGLAKIYQKIAESDRKDFELYMVGNLNLPEELASDSRVIFTGFLNASELSELLTKIDLCVGPFGLEAKQLREACPLKTRESLRNGIPVLAAYTDTCFDDNFPFFQNSEFDVEKAISFGLENRKFEKDAIAKLAQQKMSKEKLFAELMMFLDD